MPALRTNILTNYVGQFWAVLVGVAFVPIYMRILGPEAFGLVGFLISLQGVAQLFDFGVGGAVNRELARRAHDPLQHQSMRDLVRTFEAFVWPVALLIGASIWAASSAIASRWLHPQQLSLDQTANAVALMSIAVTFFWPVTFYTNALAGLERQVELNILNVVFATLRGVGVLPVLYYVSPTIAAFLLWQALVGLLQSSALAVCLWRVLPPANRGTFRFSELYRVRRFAGGLFAIMGLGVAVTQVDRVVLSASRPLWELGYYTIAASIAMGLARMVAPMFSNLYPRFSRLIANGRDADLLALYHLSNQSVAIVVGSIASVLGAYRAEVLYLWTGNQDVATKVALPLLLLIMGSAINCLLNLPFALQLASGWTRLGAALNAAAFVVGVPIAIWIIPLRGMAGAACIWLGINMGIMLIALPVMHRRLLKGELGRFYFSDILPPISAATVTAAIASTVGPHLQRDVASILWLGLVGFFVLFFSTLAASHVRPWVMQRMGLGSIV